jgi:hypothetical protein
MQVRIWTKWIIRQEILRSIPSFGVTAHRKLQDSLRHFKLAHYPLTRRQCFNLLEPVSG